MVIIKTITEANQILKQLKLQGKTIGLVPTMGALHQGHLSLINQSKNENNITICSIYVNPTQFNRSEDFDNYPNTISEDINLLEKINCTYLFLPDLKEMYPNKTILKFDFGSLESAMEGAHRPGHFNGVALIISKFFNIINPDNAYFGQKDYQQLAVVRQLTKDLFFNVKIRSCPTIREESGLAMSSRNKRLSKTDKIEAAKIYEALLLTKDMCKKNQPIENILDRVETLFDNTSIELEYLEIATQKLLNYKKYKL